MERGRMTAVDLDHSRHTPPVNPRHMARHRKSAGACRLAGGIRGHRRAGDGQPDGGRQLHDLLRGRTPVRGGASGDRPGHRPDPGSHHLLPVGWRPVAPGSGRGAKLPAGWSDRRPAQSWLLRPGRPSAAHPLRWGPRLTTPAGLLRHSFRAMGTEIHHRRLPDPGALAQRAASAPGRQRVVAAPAFPDVPWLGPRHHPWAGDRVGQPIGVGDRALRRRDRARPRAGGPAALADRDRPPRRGDDAHGGRRLAPGGPVGHGATQAPDGTRSRTTATAPARSCWHPRGRRTPAPARRPRRATTRPPPSRQRSTRPSTPRSTRSSSRTADGSARSSPACPGALRAKWVCGSARAPTARSWPPISRCSWRTAPPAADRSARPSAAAWSPRAPLRTAPPSRAVCSWSAGPMGAWRDSSTQAAATTELNLRARSGPSRLPRPSRRRPSCRI